MTQQKVYVAGKYTGLQHVQATGKFNHTKHELIGKGVPEWLIILPTDHVPEGTSWQTAMDILLPILAQCNAILFQADWGSSRGSWIEYNFALKNKISIFFESEGGIDDVAILLNAQPAKQTP